MDASNPSASMPLPKADVPAATSTSKATAAKNKGAEVVGKYLDSINKTDIVRINGYLRFANIGVGFIFGLMGLVGIFSVSGYESFLVQLYVIVLSGLLVLFEFREKFPKLESKTKENFGFMFTGFGRSVYILLIALLSFTQGTFGIIMGIAFFFLSAFNFFIMWNHPQYHSVMRGPSTTTASPDAANPAVEQRVADAAYVPTSAGVAV
ncbi:hypothetical protein H257_01425 [Aphanomyces astaci]|uniref:Golgi apparatus membrane protein TVP15 n=1 Tax=Aphanomyces astaci TaxID=112090 RepID=W4HAF1_APHAT|nr:hypothetical protein H257_01425 [Aphanomyces astaci]ETV88058.1 hypothetical protein H257_01425 [Aphanomyces astaci]|eukprot:XP_009822921.1 hypothetical protein H257_01425 [Aphanomyces astaci]